MRTKIVALHDHVVSIKFEVKFSDDVIEMLISAPIGGGYVTIDDGANRYQLCERLKMRGNTLRWSAKEPLINLVRREYKAMRRSEAKLR